MVKKFGKNRTNIFVFAENPDGCLETKWTKFEKLQMKLLQIERFFAKTLPENFYSNFFKCYKQINPPLYIILS